MKTGVEGVEQRTRRKTEPRFFKSFPVRCALCALSRRGTASGGPYQAAGIFHDKNGILLNRQTASTQGSDLLTTKRTRRNFTGAARSQD